MKLNRIFEVRRGGALRAGRLAQAAGNRKRNRFAGTWVAIAVSASASAWAEGANAPTPVSAPAEKVWHIGPTPDVRAICHTGNVLWIGTTAGLFVVDVRNAATLAHATIGNELPSNSVRAIVADGDSVFVGTDAGLALFGRDPETRGLTSAMFTPSSPGLFRNVPLSRVSGLGVGANGDLLIATSGHGAGIVTRSGGYTITRRDSLLADNVMAIADRADGVRYFATSVGLCAQFGDTSFVSFQAGAGFPRGRMRALIPGERNAFYVLVANHGVFRFDGAHAVALDSPPGVHLRDAASISFGNDGTLWVAGDGWVFARRAGKWVKASVPAPDAAARWRVIVADGAGAFVGSSDGRVVAIGRGGAFRVALPNGLPARQAQSLAPDATGAAWFLCDGRVVRADITARAFAIDDAPGDARAIAVGPDGDVWTAGRWTVRRRNAGAWSDVKPDVVESDPAFASLFVDDSGAWVGTRSGALYRYDGTMWLRHVRASNATGAAHDITAASDGVWSIWGGRPARDDDGAWRRFGGIDSAATVVDLARTPGGVWVAATESALFKFDEVKGAWIPARDWGLAGDNLRGRLRAIAFDAEGRLVAGTTHGVALCSGSSVRWLTSVDGIGGGEVSDIAVGKDHIWVGFAEDGVSVIPRRELW